MGGSSTTRRAGQSYSIRVCGAADVPRLGEIASNANDTWYPHLLMAAGGGPIQDLVLADHPSKSGRKSHPDPSPESRDRQHSLPYAARAAPELCSPSASRSMGRDRILVDMPYRSGRLDYRVTHVRACRPNLGPHADRLVPWTIPTASTDPTGFASEAGQLTLSRAAVARRSSSALTPPASTAGADQGMRTTCSPDAKSYPSTSTATMRQSPDLPAIAASVSA